MGDVWEKGLSPLHWAVWHGHGHPKGAQTLALPPTFKLHAAQREI